ncbi:c-type cytochrome [Kordiimonas lacus]|uniref:Cytochrome c, mono-and diheme variants n=1 Tax=Kordiimonas lacus TaxID=637679 RepID=A0A1G6Y2S6_9PROT|nr:cytochrome c [Kordiimonas lacus]SDD84794.1 Cytochrome c, mono-and diheme variants [Kordiimonas lacus]
MKASNIGLIAAVLVSGAAFGADAREAKGKALYEEHCAACHQFDGGGVPMMQPELIDKPRANGPIGGVIDMILFGSAAMKPTDEDYSNEMPAFGHLSDKEIALIATYVRTHFNNNGGYVTSDDVRDRRPSN